MRDKSIPIKLYNINEHAKLLKKMIQRIDDGDLKIRAVGITCPYEMNDTEVYYSNYFDKCEFCRSFVGVTTNECPCIYFISPRDTISKTLECLKEKGYMK